MHELSITESILEIVLRHAQLAGASRVTDLYLVLGELATVMDESVQFYWDFVSQGTVAHGATLHFRRVTAELECQACGFRFSLREDLACPRCTGNDMRVIAGEEFYLEAIDVTSTEEGVSQ